jgi:hypothetical protein
MPISHLLSSFSGEIFKAEQTLVACTIRTDQDVNELTNTHDW